MLELQSIFGEIHSLACTSSPKHLRPPPSPQSLLILSEGLCSSLYPHPYVLIILNCPS